ncbi:MAG: PAS domain-containing protein [Burkholderiaceae bacterium]
MDNNDGKRRSQRKSASLPSGGGDMGARIRAFDWRNSRLGEPEDWPRSLHTALGISLNSGYPMYIAWGPEFTQLYNDAYRSILGPSKHPDALGKSTVDTFAEIWDIIGPMFRSVLDTASASTFTDQMMLMDRNGYLEECYFTFSYSAILDDDDGVGGVFVAAIETTERVLRERRLAALRALVPQPTRDSVTRLCHAAVTALHANQADAPFAALYELDGDGSAHLVHSFGLAQDVALFPPNFTSAGARPWFLDAIAGHPPPPQVSVVALPTPMAPPPGWTGTLPLARAIRTWIQAPGQAQAKALLIAGLSPHLPLDYNYQEYFRSAASHIGNLIADAEAYLVEHRRAEALAEIDRAKTVFFSNVSHEFRTPLTLMLGPLDDLLSDAVGELTHGQKQQLAGVQRNGKRLLKLVNVLLDFARIEADRTSAHYRATDLAQLTTELASNFRAACERAGIKLHVECPPLAQAAFVDHAMWEKILFNLLSNALKFTFSGEIGVSLRETHDEFVLAVRDTGTGVPANATTRIFERFQRVEGALGRSHEGSGIGLALVQELVRLHGGSIAVDSELGRGSVFQVSIPKGRAHLPAAQVDVHEASGPDSGSAELYVDEAWNWVPQMAEAMPRRPSANGLPYVLLADDNADMRDYVGRLLADSYEVLCVSDGLQALQAARERRPDLILSDVMMPHLDGIALIRALRDEPSLRAVPVILLSARAGEDERHKGLDQGADDYLVKPFSSRELLVRVATLLRSVEIQREANTALALNEERLRITLKAANLGAWELDDVEGPFTGDAACLVHFGLPGAATPILDWRSRFYPNDRHRLAGRMREALQATTELDDECRVNWPDGSVHWIAIRGRAAFDSRHSKWQLTGVTLDVTERRRSEETLHQNELRLRATLTSTGTGHWDVDVRDPTNGKVSAQHNRIFGYAQATTGWSYDIFLRHVHPDDRERVNGIWHQAMSGQRENQFECRIVRVDGATRWIWVGASISQWDEDGHPARMSGLVRDISERMETDAALQDARARLDATLAAAEIGTWTWDIVQDQVVADRNLMRLFDVSEADAAGLPITRYLQAMHPDDKPEAEKRINAALHSGEPYEATYRVCHADGSTRYLIARGRAEYDGHGQPLRLPGIVLDVTEQKRAEAALRDSEAYLRQVIDASAGGFYGVDATGTTTLCNAGFLRMLGFTSLEEVVGRKLQDVIHHDHGTDSHDGVQDCPICSAAVTGLAVHTEEQQFFRRDGSSFPIEYWSYPVVIDGQLKGAVTTFIDITQRKAAEALLRRSEEEARTAKQTLEVSLAASATGTFRFDLRSHRFVEFDPTMCKLFGVPEIAGIQTLEQFLAVVHADDLPLVKSTLAHAVHDALDFELEFRIVVDGDDVPRWIFDRAKVVRDAQLLPIFLIGACTDVTWRRQSEEATRLAAIENAGLVDSLREADRRKDEFLATLSHELRNPLAPLRNALAIMSRPDAPAKHMEHLRGIMQRQVDHLVRLVDDLMEISRINRGVFELRLERVELANIVRAAVEASDHLIQAAGHQLTVDLPEQPLCVRGDPVRLIQVLGNLLNNAAKYTPSGGKIRLMAQRSGDTAVISVSDNGSGLTREALTRIFDMFSRGDRSQQPSPEGLGIGLALARRLAQMHGGTLDGRSDGPDQGSEFILRLPLMLSDAAEASTDGVLPTTDMRQLDVMVVDDNRDAVDTLAVVLQMLGARVRVAYSGPEAIAMFETRVPAVMLLDIGMPGMDGYEVVRSLRSRKALPRPTIVALTGWGQENDRRLSRDAGFDHHLVKPVDIAVMISLLDTLPRNSQVTSP